MHCLFTITTMSIISSQFLYCESRKPFISQEAFQPQSPMSDSSYSCSTLVVKVTPLSCSLDTKLVSAKA